MYYNEVSFLVFLGSVIKAGIRKTKFLLSIYTLRGKVQGWIGSDQAQNTYSGSVG